MFQVGARTTYLAMEEEMHEISWDGEWLPMELWTRVFYYMLAPMASCLFISPYLKSQIGSLQEHPLIAAIVEEFLQFRTGITYADATRAGNGTHNIPFWTQNHESTPIIERVQCLCQNGHDGCATAIMRTDVGYVSLASNQIRIRTTDSPLLVQGALTDRILQRINRLLPYGMHFRISKGDLCLFASNNLRTNPEHRFRCLRVISRDIKWNQLLGIEEQVFWLNCVISLNELYIPSWRPYS
jgi:hypothetical protein